MKAPIERQHRHAVQPPVTTRPAWLVTVDAEMRNRLVRQFPPLRNLVRQPAQPVRAPPPRAAPPAKSPESPPRLLHFLIKRIVITHSPGAPASSRPESKPSATWTAGFQPARIETAIPKFQTAPSPAVSCRSCATGCTQPVPHRNRPSKFYDAFAPAN